MNNDRLRDRFEVLGAGPDTADWQDALRRAGHLRRRRRRRTLTLLALISAVLVAAPAFAGVLYDIDFWSRETAPQAAQVHFADLNTGAPEGMAPGVDASEARSVMTRTLHSGAHTLWVAPTKAGGFCYALSRIGGTCAPPAPRSSIGVFLSRATEQTPFVLSGAVSEPRANVLEVVLDDGSSVTTNLTWVTPPINAGLYVLQLPDDRRASVLIARDGNGTEVARRTLPAHAGLPGA